MSEIRDQKLAPSGRRKIDWVRDHMPVLSGINEDFKKTKPFKGMKVEAKKDPAGNTERRCQPAGKMPAAGDILKAAVTELRGIIRMSRTRQAAKLLIIAAAGIAVADDRRQGCTAGFPVLQAAEKFRAVLFPAGCGPVVPSRCTAVQKALQGVKVDREACRQAVQRHADRFGMALTEYRKAQNRTIVNTAHIVLLSRLS